MAQTIKDRVLSGAADSNIRFSDLCALLRRLGFSARVKGSHHIFTKPGVNEILNLQPPRFHGKALSGQTGPRRDCSI